MNAPLAVEQQHALAAADAVADAVNAACDRIAPTWPLDEFIAVNPYWGWVKHTIAEAAAQLGTLGATRLTMPRAWFRALHADGTLRDEHLALALERSGAPLAIALVKRALEVDAPAPHRLPLVTDLAGAVPHAGQTWGEVATYQISQHCAAFFDDGQARWHLAAGAGLLGTWRTQLAVDRGIAWQRGRAQAVQQLATLPTEPLALIGTVLDRLGIPAGARASYLTALLLSINGWAAWCAYARWQARLGGQDDHQIVELLAIRAAWEWLLVQDHVTLPAHFAAQWSASDAEVAQLQAEQQVDWLLQLALEIAYTQPLAQGLLACTAAAPTGIRAQAVFCIDVRSEVFRRALEGVSEAVQTKGFAGFFGLPIAYAPVGSALTRPQLPGLLASAQCTTEGAEPSLAQVLARKRQAALAERKRWSELRGLPSSAFSFVESLGLLYGGKLLRDSLPTTATPPRWEDTGLPSDAQGLRPRLPQDDVQAVAGMAKAILGAMNLTRDFAPLVLLAGHGSQSANNPHAAGLDCGACGGQTGEVNARVLADLLNAAPVRAALKAQGLDIPDGTHFLPGLHNTTTDDVVLYDLDAVPAALQGELAQLQGWLAAAGERARAERAAALGLAPLAHDSPALTTSIRTRANDWAQVRPEWGLANCAAFIVAPRTRSKHLNLAGRSFLHDYDWRADEGLGVLELIMTAPMVVTNWINMQYHASTVDNRRYGSGNKVLHNVVGGRLGVFEGNGGDLRIGLPLQSLHDGRMLRHTPLRLNVFIEAPRTGIDTIIGKHAVVRDLVGNGWLNLFRIDPERPLIEQHRGGAWHAVAQA
jgi:uncharacterized protein YbcC (UPF0753/DUF2309 family)